MSDSSHSRAAKNAPNPESDTRHRLILAMSTALASSGYADISVADIVRIARASRRTFYQHFPDREACFVALLAAGNRALIHSITAAVDTASPWQIRVGQCFDAWLQAAQANPPLMLAWIRDSPGLGPEGQKLRQDFTQRYVEMLQALCADASIVPVSEIRALMIIGGLRELIDAILRTDGLNVDDVREEAVSAITAMLAPDAQIIGD